MTGRNPTDRGKAGTKYHLLVDARGLILHTLLSPANTHDSVQFEPLVETNPGVRAHRHRPGRPRRRPDKLHADKGYDYPRCRRYLHQRGIKVRIARRGIESSNHLGRVRWSSNAASPGCSVSSASACATTAHSAPCARYSPWAAS
jgi:IS5 family transposase